jgi:hypothetical protein
MDISVPRDGRAQWDPSTIMVTNAMMGRWPLTAGVETVTPDGKYILANSWPPAPRSPSSGFSGAVAAPQPETATKSSVAARSIWPNLR